MTLRRTFTLLATGTILCSLLALLVCPKPALYDARGFSSAVQDRDGKLMRLALASDERYRLRYSLNDIAPAAIDATLLYEDRYFRLHPGVNPFSLVRAVWTTYATRRRAMGASTITMQLARLRYGLNTRTVGGKLAQIGLAMQFERHYTKDEILEAYLNLAPYGGNIEGIGTAALVYFDKPPSRLSLSEALSLSVIAQNPVRRDPSTAGGYEQMVAARSRLLAKWSEAYGMSDDARAQFAMPLQVRATTELPFIAPHYSMEVLGDTDGITTTTLDTRLQALVEQRLRQYVDRNRSKGIHNASAMLLDYRSMEILASVGSVDFYDNDVHGQVSGTSAKRSPGSTLKPFVYGLAIDQGIIHPMTLLKDAPTRFAAYTPENFDRGFMGPINAEDALIFSRNVPAIELLAAVGYETFHDFLVRANVTNLQPADHYGLAMILGGNELTMKELVALYAMLANGGVVQPLVTTREDALPAFRQRLLSPEASFLVLDMLRKNPRPGSVNVATGSQHVPVAWKTGTSFAFRDAWTVGVFGQYVVAVWVGNFDGSGNASFVGRTAAAPLFFEIADALENTTMTSSRPAPAPGLNLRKIDVCADTGDLPGRHCPRTLESWFIPGKSPISVSNIHRPVRIDESSGHRSCEFDPEKVRTEVYEFWPSDILALFDKAGIAIRRPPPWSEDCPIEMRAVGGIAPRITSPSAGLTYHVRPDRIEQDSIALAATTDADVEWIFWFANDRFITRSRGNEPYFWHPGYGEYTIVAIDDLGRGHARKLSVEVAK